MRDTGCIKRGRDPTEAATVHRCRFLRRAAVNLHVSIVSNPGVTLLH